MISFYPLTLSARPFSRCLVCGWIRSFVRQMNLRFCKVMFIINWAWLTFILKWALRSRRLFLSHVGQCETSKLFVDTYVNLSIEIKPCCIERAGMRSNKRLSPRAWFFSRWDMQIFQLIVKCCALDTAITIRRCAKCFGKMNSNALIWKTFENWDRRRIIMRKVYFQQRWRQPK